MRHSCDVPSLTFHMEQFALHSAAWRVGSQTSFFLRLSDWAAALPPRLRAHQQHTLQSRCSNTMAAVPATATRPRISSPAADTVCARFVSERTHRAHARAIRKRRYLQRDTDRVDAAVDFVGRGRRDEDVLHALGHVERHAAEVPNHRHGDVAGDSAFHGALGVKRHCEPGALHTQWQNTRRGAAHKGKWDAKWTRATEATRESQTVGAGHAERLRCARRSTHGRSEMTADAPRLTTSAMPSRSFTTQ